MEFESRNFNLGTGFVKSILNLQAFHQGELQELICMRHMRRCFLNGRISVSYAEKAFQVMIEVIRHIPKWFSYLSKQQHHELSCRQVAFHAAANKVLVSCKNSETEGAVDFVIQAV